MFTEISLTGNDGSTTASAGTLPAANAEAALTGAADASSASTVSIAPENGGSIGTASPEVSTDTRIGVSGEPSANVSDNNNGAVDYSKRYQELLSDPNIKREHQRELDKVVARRVNEERGKHSAKLREYDDALTTLYAMFNVDTPAALKAAVSGHAALNTTLADAEDLTVAQYQQQLQLRRQVAEQNLAKQVAEHEARQLNERANFESAVFSAVYPNVDLAAEVAKHNKPDGSNAFLDLFNSGVSAVDVYKQLNPPAAKPSNTTMRPPENGAGANKNGAGKVVVPDNVTALKDDELDALYKKLMNN